MPAIVVVPTGRRAGVVTAVAAALLAAAPPPPASAAEWVVPVHGRVARGFDLGSNPFEGGRHRGADFAARPGTTVRAVCGGRVLVAGRVGSSGRVVTIGCGPWRVTHLPLADAAVRAGAVVDRGARIGAVAGSRQHRGLHLGVRRDGDPFGYVDPLRFLSRDRLAPPPVGALPRRVGRPPPLPVRAPIGRPEAGPRPIRIPELVPRPEPRPIRIPAVEPGPTGAVGAGSSPVRPDDGTGLAPWPAWVGLALLLAGAAGAGAGRRPRTRRTALPRAAAREVR